jgi:hypothetical protein
VKNDPALRVEAKHTAPPKRKQGTNSTANTRVPPTAAEPIEEADPDVCRIVRTEATPGKMRGATMLEIPAATSKDARILNLDHTSSVLRPK